MLRQKLRERGGKNDGPRLTLSSSQAQLKKPRGNLFKHVANRSMDKISTVDQSSAMMLLTDSTAEMEAIQKAQLMQSLKLGLAKVARGINKSAS